jgi:hypothetical protein
MSPFAVHGLIRAAVYFPALVLTLFFLLWMLALVTRSPRKPGFLSARLLLASWLAFAWHVAVFGLDSRSKGRVLSLEHDPILPSPSMNWEWSALDEVMNAEFLGAAPLHVSLLAIVLLLRRRPSPAP